MNKQPKNVLSLQKKSSTRQFESKLSLRSFAFSLHRQPMKVLREPRRRHLLRPRAVTIDDRRRSSIKTQKVALSGSWQSHASTRQRRRARHLSQPTSHNFSYFMNTKYTAAMRQRKAAKWFQCRLSPWKRMLAMTAKTMRDTHSCITLS